ncbi:MAG: hypothetical protein ACFE75_01595 [Candidatus Hodarchaeota archaeon]
MSKVFVCRECGYAFPEELSHLIQSNVQVYCERCGSPFVLKGVKFKPAPTPYQRKKKPYHILSEKKSSNLEKIIQFLNKISFIPLFIFTCISFGLIVEIVFNWDNIGFILFERILIGLISLFLLIYDRTHITQKVKEEKYNEIFLDSLCWGILGCVLYGLGVIILIKGIFILIYVITDPRNKDFKVYDYGLLGKNSLNYFSTKAGLLIILLGIYYAYIEQIYLPTDYRLIIHVPVYIEIPLLLLIYSGFLLITLITLLIDHRLKNKIREKEKFVLKDSAQIFILGIFGTIFFAAGIFILLKGILIFFLCLGKPPEKTQKRAIVEKPEYYPPTPPIPPTPPTPPYRKIERQEKVTHEERVIELEPEEKPIAIKVPIVPEKDEIKFEKEKREEIITEELKEISPKIDKREKEKREEEFELKLHDSLLPVKDEKDKKLVKEYFSKIFAVLSKDLRKQITDLKISKKEKKELLEEVAFLTKEEQIKYIEAIVNLYKEIPKKLINRIRKLPNVKPKHYDKIVEELKYMDIEEQVRFVQFLEENA